MKKRKTSWLVRLVLPALILVALGLVWYSRVTRPVQAGNILRVAGALDLQPLVAAVEGNYLAASHQSLEFIPSRDTLNDLRAGKADVALLGRQPTANELTEFTDYPVALDAVCILIDERTYNGGIQDSFIGGGSNNTNGQPAVKYEGLKNLSMDDLRGFIGMTFGFDNSVWSLQGTRAGSLTFQPYTDLDTGQVLFDPDHDGWLSGDWVWTPVQLYGEALTPGMFDTQAALLQALGLPDNVLAGDHNGFINPVYDSEELLISRTFSVSPSEAQPESTLGFNFELEIASRRITVRALRHNFALRALSIDGVDPIADPSVIYNGTYPLSRTIHLLILKPSARQAIEFAQYLGSPIAQNLIAGADYLPLNQAP